MINKLIAINSGVNRLSGQNKVSLLANIAIELNSLKHAKESKLDHWTSLINKMDRGSIYLAMFFESNGERRDQILSHLSKHRRYDADIKILKHISFNDKNQLVQTHARKVYAGHIDKGMLSDEYTDLQLIADTALHLNNLSSEKISLYSKEEKAELLSKYIESVKDLLSVKGGRGYLYILLTLETNGEFRNAMIELLNQTSKPATSKSDLRILQNIALTDQNETTRITAMNAMINHSTNGIDMILDLMSSKDPIAKLAYTMTTNVILSNPDRVLPRLFKRLKDTDEKREIESSQLMRGIITSFATSGQTNKVIEHAIYALNDHYVNNESNLYVADELWTVIQGSINPSIAYDNNDYQGIIAREVDAKVVLNVFNRNDIKLNSYMVRRLYESLNEVINEDHFDDISKLILNKKLSDNIRVGAAHLLYKMKDNRQAAYTLNVAINSSETVMKNKLNSLLK